MWWFLHMALFDRYSVIKIIKRTNPIFSLNFSISTHNFLKITKSSISRSTMWPYIIQVMAFGCVVPCSTRQIVCDKIDRNEVITFWRTRWVCSKWVLYCSFPSSHNFLPLISMFLTTDADRSAGCRRTNYKILRDTGVNSLWLKSVSWLHCAT